MSTDVILRRRLVTELTATGALRDLNWIEAFGAVPRHRFAPTFWYRDGDELRHVRPDTPRRLEITYQDIPLITQVIDGTATCSSSQPSVMARMLEALEVATGHRVLEVGTGTGYNAGLLAYRLGDDQVVTVEVDPGLSAEAAVSLKSCGYRVTTIVGDGAAGAPDEAPFDRVIATHAVRRVPPAWIKQTRPGGVIVVCIGYGLVALRVDADGAEARGRFLPVGAGFMWSRTDPAAPKPEEVLAATRGAGKHAPAHHTDDYDDERFICWLRLFVPGLTWTSLTTPGKTPEYLFAAAPDEWACITDGTAVHRGTVWRDVSAAHEAWIEAGCPGWDQLSLAVDADGNHVLSSEHNGRTRSWHLK